MSLFSMIPDVIIASIFSYLIEMDLVYFDSAILNHTARRSLYTVYHLIQRIETANQSMSLQFAKWSLMKFPNLSSFSICDLNTMDMDIFELFSSSKPFEEIVMIGGQYTDTGLRLILNQCHRLVRIRIMNNAFIVSLPLDQEPLPSHLTLTELNLSGCSSAQNGILLFFSTQCPHLQTLSLENCWSLSHAGIVAITDNCPNLTSLNLKHCSQFSDSTIVKLQTMSNLRHLNLSNCVDLTGASLSPVLSSLNQLISVNLSSCFQIPSNVLEIIAVQLNLLEELHLCSFRDSSSALPVFEIVSILSRGCLALRYLSLAGCSLTNSTLSFFQDLALFPQLSCLDLTEDCQDHSTFYPLPFYDLSPVLVDQISQLRFEKLQTIGIYLQKSFIQIDATRYQCHRYVSEWIDLGGEEDGSEEEDDIYGNITAYSHPSEYYSLGASDSNHTPGGYASDGDIDFDDEDDEFD